MSDWAPGDLALYVGENGCGSHVRKPRRCLEKGRVYCVSDVRHGPFRKLADGEHCTAPAGLHLDSVPDSVGFCSMGFRKIRPDEHEACEPEFVTLLKRSKRKVSA